MMAHHAPLRYRLDTLADPAQRLAWADLLIDVFDLDLRPFLALDIWPEGYQDFSYLDGERIVAHVSLKPMPMRVLGKDRKAAQIMSVATRPAYRKQGLFQDLMGKALAYADPLYDRLLLSTTKPDLYRPFGFRPWRQTSWHGRFEISSPSPQVDYRLLSPDSAEDLQLLRRLLSRRIPVSDTFGLYDDADVVVSMAMIHRDWHLAYLPVEDCVIVWDQTSNRLRLLDVIATAPLPMQPIARVLSLAVDHEIDVLFAPDRLHGHFQPRHHVYADATEIMVRGDWPLHEVPSMLPITSVT